MKSTNEYANRTAQTVDILSQDKRFYYQPIHLKNVNFNFKDKPLNQLLDVSAEELLEKDDNDIALVEYFYVLKNLIYNGGAEFLLKIVNLKGVNLPEHIVYDLLKTSKKSTYTDDNSLLEELLIAGVSFDKNTISNLSQYIECFKSKAALEILIKSGVDIPFSIIQDLFENQEYDLLDTLVKHGINVNPKNSITGITLAEERTNDTTCWNYLLVKGYKIDLESIRTYFSQYSAVMLRVLIEKHQFVLLEFALKNNLFNLSQNFNPATLYHQFSDGTDPAAICIGLGLLVKHNIPVNQALLEIALRKFSENSPKLLEAFIQNGFNINSTFNTFSAISFMLKKRYERGTNRDKNLEQIEWLLQHGLDPNSTVTTLLDNTAITGSVLYMAVKHQDFDLFKLLGRYGAKLDVFKESNMQINPAGNVVKLDLIQTAFIRIAGQLHFRNSIEQALFKSIETNFIAALRPVVQEIFKHQTSKKMLQVARVLGRSFYMSFRSNLVTIMHNANAEQSLLHIRSLGTPNYQHGYMQVPDAQGHINFQENPNSSQVSPEYGGVFNYLPADLIRRFSLVNERLKELGIKFDNGKLSNLKGEKIASKLSNSAFHTFIKNYESLNKMVGALNQINNYPHNSFNLTEMLNYMFSWNPLLVVANKLKKGSDTDLAERQHENAVEEFHAIVQKLEFLESKVNDLAIIDRLKQKQHSTESTSEYQRLVTSKQSYGNLQK